MIHAANAKKLTKHSDARNNQTAGEPWRWMFIERDANGQARPSGFLRALRNAEVAA
jgi:hypothetical protein